MIAGNGPKTGFHKLVKEVKHDADTLDKESKGGLLPFIDKEGLISEIVMLKELNEQKQATINKYHDTLDQLLVIINTFKSL